MAGEVLLGQFTIVRKIGQGGFGSVYLADQTDVNRKAVVKVAHADLARDPMFKERFLREAKVLAALDHHHLVKLYNFGDLGDGQLFLVMEYGGDRSLADEIRNHQRIQLSRALLIAEQICDALQEAHDHRPSVVHRDLKPANVLLSQKNGKDWIKVVDVGIAKLLHADGKVDESESTLAVMGGVNLTPEYASPEQCSGRSVDQRSDLYSLGTVLYEMIVGALPIKAASRVDYVRAQSMEQPIAPSKRGIAVPPSVSRILETALAKDPAKRFQSARDMRAAIAQARAEAARKSSFNRPVRSALALMGLFLLLGLAGVGAWWIRQHELPGFLVRWMGIDTASAGPSSSTPPKAVVQTEPKPAPAPVIVPAAARPAVAPPPPPPAPAPLKPLLVKIRSPDDEDLRVKALGDTTTSDGLTLTKDAGTLVASASRGQWTFVINYRRLNDDLEFEVRPTPASAIRHDGDVLAPRGTPGTIRIQAGKPAKLSFEDNNQNEFELLIRSQVAPN
jgi:serine/threonine-protein kinase